MPPKSTTTADKDDVVKESVPPPSATPELIAPSKIRRNDKNPRLFFGQTALERLAESIEESGVLVPITVYSDPNPADGTDYVLLDGERRWRAAKLINSQEIPAWVIAKPSGADNALRMFNIHMLREDWGDIATTWAFRDVMKETGVTDDHQLRRMTGLTPDTIRNMKRVLAFPIEWQEKVFDGSVPFNLLVELDKAVLSRARHGEKGKVLAKSVDEVRDIFLEKYEIGAFRDVVDLRKVATLIDTANAGGKVGKRAEKALTHLIGDPTATIAEAYEIGAAASVEINRVLTDIANLPDRLADLADSTLEKDQRSVLLKALESLAGHLAKVIKALKKQ